MTEDMFRKVLRDLGYEVHLGITCGCGATVLMDSFKEVYVCARCGKRYFPYKEELVKK
jgi:ribosomal protein S27AE